MNNEPFDLNDPDFMDRCAEVRRDLEAGLPMDLGEIADALDMNFETFANFLAVEMFKQDPDLEAVIVKETTTGAVH